MELRQLRYFVTLAGELHFGRAARRLSITQPPLSQAIRKLEGELGVRLFERTRRRVALTRAGVVFLGEASATLSRATQAVEAAQLADQGATGRLAVGYVAATAYTLLPLLLRDYAHAFPGVRLDLQELTRPQQFEALHREDIDVGLLRPPVPDAEFDSETILREQFVLALPAAHPLAALRRVPLARLADQPFVMYPRTPGFVFHDLVIGWCMRAGFKPRVAQEANQTHTVLGLVSAGIGVAFVPTSAGIFRLAGVAYRPLREKTPVAQTAAVWRRGDSSPALAAFLRTAKQAGRLIHGTNRTASNTVLDAGARHS
jgi:DNA-binding transcriptional LysR family regulator